MDSSNVGLTIIPSLPPTEDPWSVSEYEPLSFIHFIIKYIILQ
uniref:Uncharacterized protein n=1 Tax=Lepeophtheirus salmonis TaxID=72036 RepID=A0A0K2TKQ8_LEPSM